MKNKPAERPSGAIGRVAASIKLAYGFGDIGSNIFIVTSGFFLLFFLTNVVGINPALAGMALLIPKLWDVVSDPIMGALSDRTRSRWGRRRPYLLFGALPFALAFMLLWWRPPLEGSLALSIYYAAAYVLFDTAAPLVYMPYYTLTPELTSSYDERTSLTGYRMFFSILGSLLAFTIPLAIVGTFTPENAPAVGRMGLILGLGSALPLLFTFFGTRERGEYIEQAQPRPLDSLRAALGNRPFIFGVAIFLFTWAAIDIVQTTLLYYIKYGLKREAQSDLILASIFVTAILVLPFWNWASLRWDKRRAYMAGIAFMAVVLMIISTLSDSASMAVVLLLCILAGVGVSAAHILTWAIIPDAVEWDEWQTGERHEGAFYSLVTLAQKIASSIAIPLTLLVLDTTGYIPNAAEQPAGALTGIRIVTGLIPAVLLSAGILFAAVYPLSRQQHNQIVQGLEERRRRAAAR